MSAYFSLLARARESCSNMIAPGPITSRNTVAYSPFSAPGKKLEMSCYTPCSCSTPMVIWLRKQKDVGIQSCRIATP